MKVYLSSDRDDGFFIEAARKAVANIQSKIPFGVGVIDLVYPPLALGVDTGKVLSNVLQVLEADIILINATPTPKEKGTPAEYLIHNPGVMMEYGMVLGQDSAPGGYRWMGRMPRPTHRVFCGSEVARTLLPPVLNQEDVISFDRSPAGEKGLVKKMEEIITTKMGERLSIAFTRNPAGP